MEAANTSRPLPHFDYMPTTSCEPSRQHVREPSPHHTKKDREASRSNRSGRPYTGNHDQRTAAATRPSGHPVQGQTAKSTTTSIPYATHSRRTAWLKEQEQISKPRGEISDKGQIDRFLKKGLRFLCRERETARPQPLDEECSAEVVVTITGGCAEGMTRFSERHWYRATRPSSFQRSVAALTPRAKASAIVTSSSVTLRGSKVPKAAKSQDLAKS
ncbi:hypothetical protein Cgig2_009030 [Carnegiea gigantea]|uniref:Uncharacterized protein n=1 Tax=Carnegiea gigantea TaxID=171969 RepID=A0A9Q1KE23_9CARY|nr:hypothetical protein Cgig2_009030 [Carnegiea gigantea]